MNSNYGRILLFTFISLCCAEEIECKFIDNDGELSAIHLRSTSRARRFPKYIFSIENQTTIAQTTYNFNIDNLPSSSSSLFPSLLNFEYEINSTELPSLSSLLPKWTSASVQQQYENETCEGVNCTTIVIDHSTTCVGDQEYCNLTYNEYTRLLYDYIYPTTPEWILIISHMIVFTMGLVSILKRVNIILVHTKLYISCLIRVFCLIYHTYYYIMLIGWQCPSLSCRLYKSQYENCYQYFHCEPSGC